MNRVLYEPETILVPSGDNATEVTLDPQSLSGPKISCSCPLRIPNVQGSIIRPRDNTRAVGRKCNRGDCIVEALKWADCYLPVV